MSQPQAYNFHVNCNRHGSECPDLLKIVEEANTKREKFTVHSLNECQSRCHTRSCLILQAFLLHNPDKTEGFHIHFERSCSVNGVSKILPQPEIEITLAKFPTKDTFARTKTEREISPKKEENSMEMEMEIEIEIEAPLKKPFEIIRTKPSRDYSRSRSRSKSCPRERVRRLREKRDGVDKDDIFDRKRLNVVEKKLDLMSMKIENQETAVKDIQKTQANFEQGQHAMEKKQKSLKEAVKKLDARTHQNAVKVEKVEKSCGKVTQANNEIKKSNQEVIKSNQTISGQFQEILTLHKDTVLKLTRCSEQDNLKEKVIPCKENARGFTGYTFSSSFMKMASNTEDNFSSSMYQRKRQNAKNDGINSSAVYQRKSSEYDNLLNALLPPTK